MCRDAVFMLVPFGNMTGVNASVCVRAGPVSSGVEMKNLPFMATTAKGAPFRELTYTALPVIS